MICTLTTQELALQARLEAATKTIKHDDGSMSLRLGKGTRARCRARLGVGLGLDIGLDIGLGVGLGLDIGLDIGLGVGLG